ncbi:fibronectin type III and SPRY domain-containing protein 2 isoform X1 [Paramormyrops kingsleyae]|uniref:fibronectin type III and SPRY domain-containing protein 2 isoform X1 n=1 Tax=Paramormyrops kingsleyae TaxID=1676925 RepID=UPI003B96F09E
MQEQDLYNAEEGSAEDQRGVWGGSADGEPDRELRVPGKAERHGRQSRTKIAEEKRLKEKKRVTPPPSTFQRFSVDTNESLHFEPYIPSDEDEPRSPSFRGATVFSDEVFEEEGETEEGPPTEDAGGSRVDLKEGLGGHSERDPPDVFCMDCKVPTQASQKLFGPHKDHRVIQISRAADEVKEDLQKGMHKLEEQIGLMENFASHLEEIFITVEENFGRQEQNLEQHYNDVLQALSQRNEQGAAQLQDDKKLKLEALYTQLLECGKTLDVSKELIEEAQQIYRDEDKTAFLQAVTPALRSRIEELSQDESEIKLSSSMDFENTPVDFSDVKQMMDSVNILPAPSAPVINPQVPNSASSTSARVCWSLFSNDTVDFYDLHYHPVLDDATFTGLQAPDALEIRVKETYCTVRELLPNAQYEFWVTATNTTGVSPASEKAVYMTVPSPPIIKPRECASCPEAALIRWESGNANPVDSYTMELSEIGAEGGANAVTESIVAVPTCECLVQLQPGRHYSICVRAVNIGGPSERSEPIIIQTTGTSFHLLEDTAHPCLSISSDGLTMFYTDEDLPLSGMVFSDNTFARCVAVLGELIPVRGKHYWEVEVEDRTEFRIGVAYEDTQRNGFLGGNSTSWCMRHVITPSRHKYEFLHNGWTPEIRITVHPKRVGVLLDYDAGKLSFFNAHLAQHLYTFQCRFLHHVHPCFALDNPGALALHNSIAAPAYTMFN